MKKQKDGKKARNRFVVVFSLVWLHACVLGCSFTEIYIHNNYYPYGEDKQVIALIGFLLLLCLPIYLIIERVEFLNHKERSESKVVRNHAHDLDFKYFGVKEEKENIV